ncbi:MAG: ribonuclease HII [Clostridia bacterium]|nr:ribonuclease HII [Clostridia bacterium]
MGETTMKISQLKKEIQVLNPEEGLKLLNEYQNELETFKLKQLIEEEDRRLDILSSYENEMFLKGYKVIAGMDEVGRGPLAGPVVVACVVLPRNYKMFGINDSKKVPASKREILSEIIKRDAISYSIIEIDNRIIDEINILEATKLAMEKAFNEISKDIDCLLIDAVSLNNIKAKQISLIKGDEKSISIAAASIIAKVYRDHMMIEYDKIFPEYHFASNKGYGSSAHIEAIKKYGPTEIHRTTFIKNIV